MIDLIASTIKVSSHRVRQTYLKWTRTVSAQLCSQIKFVSHTFSALGHIYIQLFQKLCHGLESNSLKTISTYACTELSLTCTLVPVIFAKHKAHKLTGKHLGQLLRSPRAS